MLLQILGPNSLIANRLLSPRIRGLIGGIGGGEAPPDPQSPQPPQAAQGGGPGALSQLFGGVNDPNLNAEQNTRASKAARLQAGLATILASQDQRFGGAIATGALVGQQAGAAARGAAIKQVRTEQLQGLLADADLSTAQGIMDARAAILPLIAAGDTGALATNQALESFLPAGSENIDISESGGFRIARSRITGLELWRELIEQSPAERREERRDIASNAFEIRDKLGDDFRSESARHQTLAQAGRIATTAVRSPNTITDQQLIVAFSQLIDPSVVREGEFTRVAGAGGTLDRMRGLKVRILRGEIPGNIRELLVKSIKEMVALHSQVFKANTLDTFGRRARAAGIPEDELQNLFRDPYAGINIGGSNLGVDLGTVTGDPLDAYLPVGK